jgi:signal peptide peptidase SppA
MSFADFIKKFKREYRKKDLVNVIRLQGVIGKVSSFSSGLTYENTDFIETAFKSKKLKAIALIINSPGGSPVQSELIYKNIKQLAEKKHGKKIPIIAFCEDVAASGGYFLACSADEIYASNSSIIGSIGVISSGFGFTEVIKKLGIERRIISQGKNKSTLDPFLASKKEDVEIIKSIQKDIHEGFKDIVKDSRQKRLKGSDDEIFNGKFWSGKQALELGLIDGIGDVKSIMKEKFGKKIRFKNITPAKGFFKKKFGISENRFAIIGDVIYTKLREYSIWERFNIE